MRHDAASAEAHSTPGGGRDGCYDSRRGRRKDRVRSRHRESPMAHRRSASIQPPAVHEILGDRVADARGDGSVWHGTLLGALCATDGHTVTLLPPAYVRPYVRRNKTDRTDAEALLEATRSGQIPSVAVKSVAQQTLVALHRVRDQWMTTRTARINTVRGLLREQGFLLPAGAGPAVRAIPAVGENAEAAIADSSATHDRAHVTRRCARWSATFRARARAPFVSRCRSGRHSTARDSRHRLADRDCAGRHGEPHPCLSSRATICELVGADAARVFQRRPSPARRDQ